MRSPPGRKRRETRRGKRQGPESEWGPVSPPAPTCPSFDCRRWVARPSLAGRLRIAPRALGPRRSPAGSGARPRSLVRFPPVPGRSPKAPRRSPSGRPGGTEIPTRAPLSDRARPKPRRLLGSHRGRSPSGRPFFGSRRRPKALPLSRSPPPGPKPLRRIPFGSRLGRSLPRLPPARAAGRFPRPSPVRPCLPPRERAFRPGHGRFREIPPRIRLRLCGRGFVRLPAFRLGASVLGGATAPSAWAAAFR
jgi:hypothetical protein